MSIHLEHPLQPPTSRPRQPPSTPSPSSSSSSSFSVVNGRKTYTLAAILDTFQCNIDQEQAWALIYQATRTLNKLLNDLDTDQKHCHQIQIRLVKLTSFSNIIIDCNGDVLPATWISTTNSVHGDHGCSGSDDNVTMNPKSDDKRLMNESINTLIASLATIIYSALEWNWRQQQKLFKCDNPNADKEQEEEELDLEESLELLMLSMLRGSENKDLVDEGYIDALEESYLQSVLTKCEAHFDDLVLCCGQPTQRRNSIIEMLSTNNNANTVTPDLYYRTVCKMLVDEADKLGKLVNQFCDPNCVQKCLHFSARPKNSNNCDYHHGPNDSQMDTESLKIWAQTWIKVMSELRFGVRLRPTPVLQITDLDQNPMVSNSARLKDQIKITKDRLRRASTASVPPNQSIMPVITEASIIESLHRLKPASRRTLPPILKPIEPCLHDRLMEEIRQYRYDRLRPTTTIIKQASITELYFREKRYILNHRYHHYHYHHHFEPPNESYLCSSSLYDIGGNVRRSSSTKRKMNPDGTLFGHLRPARSISGVLINRHNNHHKSPDRTIPLVETSSPGKSLEKRKRKKTRIFHACNNRSDVNLLFKTSTPELKPSKSCTRIQMNSFPIECSELSSFEAGDGDDDLLVNQCNQRSPSVSSLERRNSFESLPLVNHGNSLNGQTSFMDSLPSSISISLSSSSNKFSSPSNNATSKSLRSLSSNFITISNPYLRRSFNRPKHHRHHRRPSTQEPSERSFSLLSTTTSTTTTAAAATTSTMTPRSKEESDDFAKPLPPTSTDVIDSLFRYQVLRKSFRSSFNIMFGKWFGSKNVDTETEDKLKKE